MLRLTRFIRLKIAFIRFKKRFIRLCKADFQMEKAMKQYFIILSLAGSDCSGGAGIQADIKTMSALGCYAASVITSITVQNTCGVKAIQNVKPEIVEGQIIAVMDDIRPAAIKIGMVNDADTIDIIADTLKRYETKTLIVDPVMVASGGQRLMQEDALEIFEKRFMPMATLLTPNIPEAEILSGIKINTIKDIDRSAKIILSKGCKSVLIKGGHLDGQKTDRLYTPHTSIEIYFRNIQTHNTHGTGCTLSSAITAYLARGEKMQTAITKAKEYITKALEYGAEVKIGNGIGPVYHFFD